jgi:hypothetical protein
MLTDPEPVPLPDSEEERIESTLRELEAAGRLRRATVKGPIQMRTEVRCVEGTAASLLSADRGE